MTSGSYFEKNYIFPLFSPFFRLFIRIFLFYKYDRLNPGYYCPVECLEWLDQNVEIKKLTVSTIMEKAKA